MRLTCPNCAAQYEVPDDVIPDEGRDVQCSNCGQTWFQESASGAAVPEAGAVAEQSTDEDAAPAAEPAPEPQAPVHEPAAEFAASGEVDQPPADDSAAYGQTGGELAAEQEAAPETDDLDDEDEESSDEQDMEEPSPEPAAPARAEQRGLSPELSDILREEAERERSLRAAESAPIETQTDLGLDDLPEDETERRARQVRDRMARMRGEDPRQIVEAETGSRRGLLPDIEEINSTLRAGGSGQAMPADEPDDSPAPRRKSGFTRGFAFAVLIVLLLVMIYDNAPLIASKVPQADPYLSSYVASVEQARLWLDAQVKALSAPQVQ